MRATHWSGLLLLATVSLVACDRETSTEGAAPAAPPALNDAAEMPKANLLAYSPRRARRAGSTLAYEHAVTIELGAQHIPARVDAMQQACLAQPAGHCELLNVQQTGGDQPSGLVTVRVVPQGIDPLIKQAATDGEIAERTVHADDLAESVSATALLRSRLEKEHARLLNFQDRPNVKLGDMLKLSERLADVESQLDMANQRSAQERRRIDKELLTVRFRPKGAEVGGSAVADAVRDSLEITGRSTAWLIRAVAASIPVLVVLSGAWMLWRVLRRRRAVALVP